MPSASPHTPALSHNKDPIITIDDWHLTQCTLRPNKHLRQSFTPPPQDDPLITFTLTCDDTERPLLFHRKRPSIPVATSCRTIHRSVLQNAPAPIRHLVSPAFREGRNGHVEMAESPRAFQALRAFLYCEPIAIPELPFDFPLFADRWGLNVLFEACFRCASQGFTSSKGTEWDYPWVHYFDIAEIVSSFVPIMTYIDVPLYFKRFLARRVGVALFEVEDAWEKKDAQKDVGLKLDVDGKFAKRRKALTSGSEQALAKSPLMPWYTDGHDVWKCFLDHGMLSEVVFVGTRCAQDKADICLYLDVIMFLLEPWLSDHAMLQLLECVDWSAPGVEEALEQVSQSHWPPRAILLLARSKKGMILSDVHKLRILYPVEQVGRCVSNRRYDCTLDGDRPDINNIFGIGTAVHIDRDKDEKASMRVELMALDERFGDDREKDLPNFVDKRRVWVDVTPFAYRCDCGLEATGCIDQVKSSSSGRNCLLAEEDFEDMLDDEQGGGGGCTFVALNTTEMDEWMKVHASRCTLIVACTVYLERREYNGKEC